MNTLPDPRGTRTGVEGSSRRLSCEEAVAALGDHVLRLLPAERGAAVSEHLEECPSCRRVLIVLKFIGLSFKDDDEDH